MGLCFPLLFVSVCLLGGEQWKELLQVGTGGQNVEESPTSKLVKIVCNANLLENELEKSRDCRCPVWSPSVSILSETVCICSFPLG